MKPQYDFARRNLLRAAIGLAATVAMPACADPARYPEHPVHLVVPFRPEVRSTSLRACCSRLCRRRWDSR